MDGPTIRLARPAEAAILHAVVDAAYRHYIPRIGKPPGPMNDDYAARIAASQAWVLEDAGTILGIMVLEHGSDGFLLDKYQQGLISREEVITKAQDPSTILTRLLHTADENPMLASIGIVCLDEFDKIASGQNNAIFAGAGTTKDVTGMGVQRELLKMLEASEVVVPLDLTHSSYADHVVMSTADIAFIAAGAFSGFQQIASRRAMRDQIGFGRDQHASGVDPDAIAVDFTAEEVENVANFQAYGFLPELIARFTRIVPFKALDAATLKDILRTDVVTRMTREFKAEGLALSIDEAVLDHIVADAQRKETGARGLASTLTRRLEDVAFDSFGADGHTDTAVQVSLQAGDLQISVG